MAEPVSHVSSWSPAFLPGATGGRRDPAAVKDAFESLLLGQLMAPLERSLQNSGMFPQGAPGEIYAHFWKVQMGGLLAESIDLLPGWSPGASGESAPEPSGFLPLTRFRELDPLIDQGIAVNWSRAITAFRSASASPPAP